MQRCIIGLVALALLVGGCGGDDDEPESASTPEPTATEAAEQEGAAAGGGTTLTADPGGDLAWEPSEMTAPAGSVTITLVNESDVPHAVEVEGNGVEEESETITASQTELTVDLEPGEYRFYCPVGNHAQAGMEGTLTVE